MLIKMTSFMNETSELPSSWPYEVSRLCNEPDGPELREIKEVGLVAEVKKKVVSCWKSVKDPDNFPGPQPVSLERSELIKLNKYAYAVCEKTDGMRYFLFATKYNGYRLTVIIDRAFRVFEAPGAWSCVSCFDGTLLDGEIVRDSDGLFTYYPHDCILRGGINYSQEDFRKRYEHSKEVAILWKKLDTTAFDIRFKNVRNLKNIQELLKDSSQGTHAVDGLIFTPIGLGVQTGTQHSLIKWKMADKHTFDFEVEKKGQRAELYLFDKMSLIKFKTLNKRTGAGRKFMKLMDELLAEKMMSELSISNGDSQESKRYIVECCVEENEYIPLKLRPDKTRPNSIRTVERTLKNIEENITIEELVELATKLGNPRYNHVF